MSKLRRVGDILLDMEPLILELVEDHDLQWSDILGLVHIYLQVHCPNAREEYDEGGHPIFYYGPELTNTQDFVHSAEKAFNKHKDAMDKLSKKA